MPALAGCSKNKLYNSEKTIIVGQIGVLLIINFLEKPLTNGDKKCRIIMVATGCLGVLLVAKKRRV